MWQQSTAGNDFTLGLKHDGSIVSAGYSYKSLSNLASWDKVAALACGRNHVAGVKTKGTMVAAGENNQGQCNVTAWKNIRLPQSPERSEACTKLETAVKDAEQPQRANTKAINTIPQKPGGATIAAGKTHAVAVRNDGTAAVAWEGILMFDSRCNVSDWRDIAAVDVSDNHTFGLKRMAPWWP